MSERYLLLCPQQESAAAEVLQEDPSDSETLPATPATAPAPSPPPPQEPGGSGASGGQPPDDSEEKPCEEGEVDGQEPKKGMLEIKPLPALES